MSSSAKRRNRRTRARALTAIPVQASPNSTSNSEQGNSSSVSSNSAKYSTGQSLCVRFPISDFWQMDGVRKARPDHTAGLQKARTPSSDFKKRRAPCINAARPTAIVECCSGPKKSVVSTVAPEKGLRAARLTADSHRLGTVEGNRRAEANIRSLHSEGLSIHPSASLPCGPWTLWTAMNEHRLGPRFRRQLHER